MPVALLDINVIIALFDPDHVHHEVAHDWFAGHHEQGWATCPLSENGAVRVLSDPSYGFGGLRPGGVAARVSKFCSSRHHVFWTDVVSLCDKRLFNLSAAAGHRQVTDLYLLGLAVKMKGCLATFDRSIPLEAVKGATTTSLRMIAPTG